MWEPSLFGVPLTLMFLYFIWYSLMGWCMESIYCSILEHQLINRGFLHLPLCPIYGVGVLIMVNFFSPFTVNPLLFYVMATLVMSAWEYFVGWLLETTTHMKYWDYSNRKFNVKGRICLANCIWWGIASYLVIYWVHPTTEALLTRLPVPWRQGIAIALAAAVLADTVTTIRQLALLSKALSKAEEARVQLELGKKAFQQQMASKKDALQQSLEVKRSEWHTSLESTTDRARQALGTTAGKAKENLSKLEERRSTLMTEAARHARRFVRHYSTMTSRRYPSPLAELKRRLGKNASEEQRTGKETSRRGK